MLTFFVGGGIPTALVHLRSLGQHPDPHCGLCRSFLTIMDLKKKTKTKQQQKRFPWVEAPSVKCIHISSVAACSPGLKREDAVVRFFTLDFLGPYLPIQWSIFSYEFAQ